MLPASAPAASPARDQILASARILAVDWARALAYVLMIIAHTAPSDGPARLFMISEFVTAPLFALLASGAALLAMAGLLIAPNLLGLFPVHAYDGTPAEQIGGILGAAGFLLLCWSLERSAFGRALPPALARAAAVPGQMALSLYVLQIAVHHAFQIRNPLERDDSWGMLALLLVLGIGGALAWRAVLQRAAIRWPAAARWQRGPLEGAIRLLEDAIAPLPARPTGLRPGASPEISSP